ncbi:hypothetical protein [Nonomuraea aurantiaca]|jgi:fermentation-respiration switch protein FrsA (DUF1100 family)|uniref:hypothetical protein n=1 Tax=Nonomuraea aurantiaca TaxID=2878562 RepID=UPI001CDA275C|nr:hypothetical protein [Nonomuraea aurantiaca]MCA2220938.1 hypothetical protein [Nonomuraea aurantiaca]
MTVTATPSTGRKESVSGRVRTLAGLSLLALALLLAAILGGAASTGAGLRTIGHDAGPQVLATTGLYRQMSEMDALVAETLLLGSEYGPQQQADLTTYDQRRLEISESLLKAYRLALDNPAEQRTVESLIEGLGRYERLATQARLLDVQSKHTAGQPPDNVVQAYQKATDLMHRELLPQAYNLTLETGTIVRRAHVAERSTTSLARFAVIVTGLLALACLLGLQTYLTRRFRRVFAPALVVATVLTGAGLVTGTALLNRQGQALDEAKRGGFDAVLTLTRARAISKSMHGDQNRYLLDRFRRDTYEHAFLDKSQTIAAVESTSLPDYQSKLRADFQGLLGSLTGQDRERLFAVYQKFQQADARMRTMTPEAAIKYWDGELTQTYESYDKVLEELVRRHESDFERAIDSGDGALETLWRLIPAGLAAGALLILVGIWPRLREYR